MDRFTYKKQTIMKEEEFLKQISLILDVPLSLMHSETQTAIKETYKQYAAEVSRERATKYAHKRDSSKKPEFLLYYQDWYDDYDNWIKEQEEQ